MMNNLPDIIDFHLKILFIGFNPGLQSAETGHHYAGKSNNFWKLLYDSDLTPYRLKPEEDARLLDFKYGSTNIVARPSRGISELKAEEYKEGAIVLKKLLQRYQPKIACYVGVGVYKKFTGRKEVKCGLQEQSAVEGVLDYVCSSPSGLNRMPYTDQLKCFIELKKLILQ